MSKTTKQNTTKSTPSCFNQTIDIVKDLTGRSQHTSKTSASQKENSFSGFTSALSKKQSSTNVKVLGSQSTRNLDINRS